MRILHVLDHSIPLHSGYTFRTRAILEHQRALGWETEHVTSTKQGASPGPEETVDGLRFFRTRPTGSFLERLPVVNQWEVVSSLRNRILELLPLLKPDVLHAHSPSLNGIAAVRAGRKFGIPVVYEVRAFWEDAGVDHGTTKEWGFRYRLSRALESWVLRRADAVTTICEGLRSEIVGRGIPAGKVTVIPNAVDVERFSTEARADPELRRRLGLDGKRVLGFIGSFYGYEGISLLLDAMPRMLGRMPDVRILLVGGGLQEEALRRQAAALGIADKVILTGRVPHDQVDGYYNLVEVLVYPRLPMRLTDLVTPLKPLEAMAQGRLVVASDVGGHKELIRDGETGALFRAGDAEALAEAVLGLLSDPGRCARMRAAGRRFVEEERSWKGSVDRYRAVYGSLPRR